MRVRSSIIQSDIEVELLFLHSLWKCAWCYTSRLSAMTFAARCTGSVQIMVLLFESVSRHQRLGCSLQQCSAVCFQLQQQVFFFFFSSLLQYDLGPKLHPVIPHFVEENEENCIHLTLTLTLCTQRLCVAVLSILECVCVLYERILVNLPVSSAFIKTQLFAQIAESAKFM